MSAAAVVVAPTSALPQMNGHVAGEVKKPEPAPVATEVVAAGTPSTTSEATAKAHKKYDTAIAPARVKRIFTDHNMNKKISERTKELKASLKPFAEAEHA